MKPTTPSQTIHTAMVKQKTQFFSDVVILHLMLKINLSIHKVLICLAVLLCAPLANAACTPHCATNGSSTTTCRAAASAPCYVIGGNSNICSSEPALRLATEEWRIEDQCYVEYGICERGANGNCGWRATDELSQCITDLHNEIPESIEKCGSKPRLLSPMELPPK